MAYISIYHSQPLPIWLVCSSFATAGALSHLLYFIHGTHIHNTVDIAIFYLGMTSMLYVGALAKYHFMQGLVFATAACASYFTALFASMTVYRLWFHPLSSFPGPRLAAVTKFYGPWIARNGRMHWEHQVLWRKHGKFVRIAPDELLVESIDAIQKVHGSGSGCSKKDTSYSFVSVNGIHNLDSVDDHGIHRARRVFWDKAFSSKALLAYEEKVNETVQDWLNRLFSLEGQPVNTSLYSLLIPFDNIGKVGYSHNFGLVKAGKENNYLALLEAVFKLAGSMGQSSWPLALANFLRLNSEQRQAQVFSTQVMTERLKNDSTETEDIVKYFLEDFRSDKPKAFHNKDILDADSIFILLGGTDTIAVVLSYSFYELAKDPQVRLKFLQAVSPAFGKSKEGTFANRDLESISYVDAFINEIMRVYNPTANNGPRRVPDEGLEIAGTFIPGGTTVIVPIHIMHRSAEYFVEPSSFIPERWTTRPELVLDRRAFHPFLYGPYNCPGRRLAYVVIRLILASTVWNFDIELAPGEAGVDIHDKARNNIILKAGPLNCVFHKREVH